MKKTISFLLGLLVALSSMCIASAEVIMLPDFSITNDGEITDYHGGEYVIVPDKIDGVPVEKIGDMAFYELAVEDVYLSEGLHEIGKSAFEGCNTKSVNIASTVKIIGDRAFANCEELLTVFINFDENTTIGENAFCGTGHLIFYVNCNVDTKAIEKNIILAKGDKNLEVHIRHVASEYDDYGNIICNECGYQEQILRELPFTDVPSDAWYRDYVVSAYSNNIINGKSETIFDPESSMTCGEAVKIAASVHMIYNDTMPDTCEGPWYQQYVDYCYKHNLIETDVAFDWEKEITRSEMAYIFASCDPFDNGYTYINEVPITDIGDINDKTTFANEIVLLYNKGIVIGDEEMNFHPNDNIKRSEVAAIVSRIIDCTERIELPKG